MNQHPTPRPVRTLKTLTVAAGLATFTAIVNLLALGRASARPLAILLIVILGALAITAGLIARDVARALAEADNRTRPEDPQDI